MVQFSDTESETDAQAKEAGKQQAKLDLLNHTRITNVSFEPANKAFEYLKDYDLGDRVNLTIDKISQTYAFRIIEVDEVYTNNTREIKLQFGDSKKLNYKKGRW